MSRRMLAAALMLPLTCGAWNSTGHKVVAAIAYKKLKPAARARVDALLASHPDFAAILTRNAPPDAEDRALSVFLTAATWPDIIKSDPRFFNETRAGTQPTPVPPGFPDSKQHRNWHFRDVPFSPDNTATEEQQPPHALSELVRIIGLIGKPASDPANPAFLLPWLEHLVGDVHQPLHCVSRFTAAHKHGDAGGNSVFVTKATRLHALWDDLAGRDDRDATVIRIAGEIASQNPEPTTLSLDPAKWIQEGFELAKSKVYTFGPESGSPEHPVTLRLGYAAAARKVARPQIALAGYRLAALLNEHLR